MYIKGDDGCNHDHASLTRFSERALPRGPMHSTVHSRHISPRPKAECYAGLMGHIGGHVAAPVTAPLEGKAPLYTLPAASVALPGTLGLHEER